MFTAILDPFIAGTSKTFQEMCGVEFRVDAIGSADAIGLSACDLAGIVGVTGSRFQGVMSLRLRERAFLNLMERMLGESLERMRDDLLDGVAELSNIVFGQAKRTLNEQGHQIRMALPRVIHGEGIQYEPVGEEAICVRMTAPEGVIEIVLSGSEIEQQDVAPSLQGKSDAPKLDAAVLMAFVDGIRKTFEVQCGIRVHPGKPFFGGPESDVAFDVGSMIGVTSDVFSGSFALLFEERVLAAMIGRLLGTEVSEIGPDHVGAANELVNIAYGVAKSVLSERGYSLQMALPSLIRGHAVRTAHGGSRPPILLPFDALGGRFWMEASFEAGLTGGQGRG